VTITEQFRYYRFAIVGASGSGKTTLGQQVGQILNLRVIDLDSLNWEANWTMAPTAVFRQRVALALQGDAWVVSGNYSRARDLIWSRADTLVWLDYPLRVVFWRLFRRTIKRIVTREELFGGNRETLQSQFLSRDSLFLWLLQSQPRHRREYPKLLELPEYRHLKLLRFYSPRETKCWLESL